MLLPDLDDLFLDQPAKRRPNPFAPNFACDKVPLEPFYQPYNNASDILNPKANSYQRKTGIACQDRDTGSQLTWEEAELLNLDLQKNWVAAVEISGFTPDQMKISLDEEARKVTVYACNKWEDKEKLMSSNDQSSKYFVVPENVKLETIKSKMLPTGKLVLHAELNTFCLQTAEKKTCCKKTDLETQPKACDKRQVLVEPQLPPLFEINFNTSDSSSEWPNRF